MFGGGHVCWKVFWFLLTRIAQDVWLSKSTDPGDMIQVAEKIDDVKIRPKG